jgi:outer membrane murein-binding lipoprotein Lpp
LESDIAELEAKRDAAVADAQAADDKLAAVQSQIRKLAGV